MKVPEGKFFTIAGTEYKPGMEIQERHLKMMSKKHMDELSGQTKKPDNRPMQNSEKTEK